ncbi:MAG: transposase [Deltaproteobacteria bacterium]|nr:transposase [Deltaproteobacteria bacterium]
MPQTSFFDAEFVDPECLTKGTMPWLLARSSTTLFPDWLFIGWKKAGRGRNPWSPRVLMALLILRYHEEGASRLGAIRRAARDSEWRAALGLAFGAKTPSERTLRRFKRFLCKRHPIVDVETFRTCA